VIKLSLLLNEILQEKSCWKGYIARGTKKKGDRMVPNCVPLEEQEELEEAEYQGRKVTLNKPFLTPDGPKKRSVYVKNEKGNVVKVNFGQKGVAIKKHLPKHRKSYRARHGCSNPGPKWKANYWSCKAW
jgi:hypothetical protein